MRSATRAHVLSPWSSVALDGLRVLAAELVVLGHVAITALRQAPTANEDAPYVQQGAVVVFFVLSGMLITLTSLAKRERGSYGFSAFGIDRFARIFTAFAPCLVLIVVIDVLARWTGSIYYTDRYASALDLQTFVGNLGMLHDYPYQGAIAHKLGLPDLSLTSLGSARPLWTIAVEWWIYLFFGLVLAAAFRRRHPLVWTVVLVALAPVPVFHALGGRGHGLALVWAAGALAAVGLRRGVADRVPTFALVAGAVGAFGGALVVAYGVVDSFYSLGVGLPMVVAAFCLVAALDRRDGEPSERARKVSAWAGFSLTLYLLHYSLMVALLPFLDGHGKPFAVVSFLVVANLVSWAVASVTEVHYRSVRRWLHARRRAADPLPAAAPQHADVA